MHRNMIVFSIILFVVGLAFFLRGFSPSLDTLQLYVFGEDKNIVFLRFERKLENERARSKGPSLLVYSGRTEGIDMLIYSFNEIDLNETRLARCYKKKCYVLGDGSVLSYEPFVYYVQIMIGMICGVLGGIVFLFRRKLQRWNDEYETNENR